jgi:hypothetical protein
MDVQLVVIVAIVLVAFFGVRAMLKASTAKLARMQREMQARQEALFAAGFPELQPHFHPKNVYEYAKARQARKASSGPFQWRNPPGFALATVADVVPDGLKDRVRLLDAKDAELANFVFEEHAEGAAVRVGKGKFTVGLKSPEPRVRYWHPEREFKWTPTSWKMTSALAEQALHSRTSRSSSSDDDGPDWSSSTGTFATGAAVGAGAAVAASAMGRGDSAPDFSGVESGSSSTSTSY